jgi:hypothetical protein
VLVTGEVDPEKDPDSPVATERPEIDRGIYFVKSIDPNNPTPQVPALPDNATAFHVRDLDPDVPTVRPGRYMVIGSGTDADKTNVFASQMGQRLDQLPSARPRKPLRRIELDMNGVPNPVRLIDNEGVDDAVAKYDLEAGAVKPFPLEAPAEPPAPPPANPAAAIMPLSPRAAASITDVAVINAAIRSGVSVERRLTLSEPAGGYPGRVGNVEFARYTRANSGDPSEEGEYALGGNIAQPKPIDTPLDDGDPELREIGTDFDRGRVLFLQRLANPLLPYDAETNPYRTVDMTRAFINVFNGRLRPTEEENGKKNTELRAGFSSVERGWKDPARGPAEFDIWSHRLPDDGKDNLRAGMARNHPAYSLKRIPSVSLGFLNRALMNKAETDLNRLRMVPEKPFPWLSWNDRPFVSAGELMLVPRLDSQSLLANFSMHDDKSPYDTPAEDKQGDELNEPSIEANEPAFAHVENFRYQRATGGPNGVPKNLYRLLDYVETPSLFVGTQRWLNPEKFTGRTTPITTSDDPRLTLQPPFNAVSEFRTPGKINLNTIFSDEVWKDLFHGDTNPEVAGSIHPGPAFANFVASRKGLPGSPLQLDPTSPTLFVNPFRSADAGELVPLDSMVRAGVDCTLQRSIDAKRTGPGNAPLFEADTEKLYNHAERSAYFRMQPTVRLSNLVTTRSNVYAVWVTIGFFEVEELPAELQSTTPDTEYQPVYNALAGMTNATLADAKKSPLFSKIYPGDYALGQEDGIETGDIRRMRAFYIIDRTIPAGFEPGADHNVENVIRLRRRIE